MQRREFITALGGMVAALPSLATARPHGSIWLIGFVTGQVKPAVWEGSVFFQFEQGMRELGYVEGRDFTIEWRFADGDYSLFPKFAMEFAQLKVDIIVTSTSGRAVPPMREANPNTPIVMAYSIDPVGQGLVVSLAHPGGNTTGIDADIGQAMGKQIELLQTAVPDLTRVAVLANSGGLSTQGVLKNVRTAAEKARIDVLPNYVHNADDLENVFETMSRERVGAVIVTVDALLFSHRQRVADLAIAKHLPSMFGTRDEVVAGGLMSYNGIFQFRQAATFVDKIIKGAKPGDLPVELPTKYWFCINLKTAKALGLTLSESFMLRADELIE